jgi:hypothetical protein
MIFAYTEVGVYTVILLLVTIVGLSVQSEAAFIDPGWGRRKFKRS